MRFGSECRPLSPRADDTHRFGGRWFHRRSEPVKQSRHRACPGGLAAFARLLLREFAVAQRPLNHRGKPGGDFFTASPRRDGLAGWLHRGGWVETHGDLRWSLCDQGQEPMSRTPTRDPDVTCGSVPKGRAYVSPGHRPGWPIPRGQAAPTGRLSIGPTRNTSSTMTNDDEGRPVGATPW